MLAWKGGKRKGAQERAGVNKHPLRLDEYRFVREEAPKGSKDGDKPGGAGAGGQGNDMYQELIDLARRKKEKNAAKPRKPKADAGKAKPKPLPPWGLQARGLKLPHGSLDLAAIDIESREHEAPESSDDPAP